MALTMAHNMLTVGAGRVRMLFLLVHPFALLLPLL